MKIDDALKVIQVGGAFGVWTIFMTIVEDDDFLIVAVYLLNVYICFLRESGR